MTRGEKERERERENDVKMDEVGSLGHFDKCTAMMSVQHVARFFV